MSRSVELYEQEGHTHQGKRIGIARHGTYAPFACNGTLALAFEANPMRAIPGERLVTERCQGCGKVVNVWAALPELTLSDADDDGA